MLSVGWVSAAVGAAPSSASSAVVIARAISSWMAKTSSISRSYVSDQRWKPLSTWISWAVIRRRLPDLRTLPSMTFLTFNCRPISPMSRFCPLNWKDEVRAATRNWLFWASRLSSSSDRPSEKYSCSGSDDMLTKGRTASERASCSVIAPAVRDCSTAVADAGAAASSFSRDINRSPSNNTTAKTRKVIIVRSSLRPVFWVTDSPGAIFDSSLIPSGVISNTQEKIKTTGRPTTAARTNTCITQPGAVMMSRTKSMACSNTQATTT